MILNAKNAKRNFPFPYPFPITKKPNLDAPNVRAPE
jgi:hypothetical protein